MKNFKQSCVGVILELVEDIDESLFAIETSVREHTPEIDKSVIDIRIALDQIQKEIVHLIMNTEK